MFKKLKAIRNHKIFKDFVFVFFGWDTYKNHKAKKEVMPIDIDYYEWPLLTTHILYHFCFSVYLVVWVTLKYGTYYFIFEFWKKDLWIILKEIGLAFWTCRLPFVVTAINFIEYGFDFFTFIKNKRYRNYFKNYYRSFFRKKTRKKIRRVKKKLKKIYYFIKKKIFRIKAKYLYQYNWIDKIECLLHLFY